MVQFDLLLIVTLEQLEDKRLLGANQNAHHQLKAHTVGVANFCISYGLLVLSLSYELANHSRYCVRNTEGKYESEREEAEDSHLRAGVLL